MARSATLEWPQKVTVGHTSLKVYRQTAPRSRTGFEYVVVWHTADGRKRKPYADPDAALREARLKAEQLNAGRIEAASFDRADVDELQAIRALTGDIPALAAVKEWARARELCKGSIIPAAEQWAARNGGGSVQRVTVAEAVELYLKARRADGIDTKVGPERTLTPRRGPAADRGFKATFGAHAIADLTPGLIAGWLETHFPDPVSRNTRRKHVVALFRWCRKRGYLPLDVTTAAERTDRAKEVGEEIGLVSAAELRQAFDLVSEKAPSYLPALALAAFCGLRRAEVHGQRWEDIDFERKALRVSVAKPGTPQKRRVPLEPAALAWLEPRRQEAGPVCSNLTMDRVRDICRTAGLDLADNGFRHSWISARVEATGDIARTSLEAGNTPRVINRHYRELLRPDEAEAWFSVTPGEGCRRGMYVR